MAKKFWNDIEWGAWHDWFAWYPVTVGKNFIWFETIQRRKGIEFCGMAGTDDVVEYRLKRFS